MGKIKTNNINKKLIFYGHPKRIFNVQMLIAIWEHNDTIVMLLMIFTVKGARKTLNVLSCFDSLTICVNMAYNF